MAIKRKILTFKDFTKGKDTLENPVKHSIKESEDFVLTPRDEMMDLLRKKFPNVWLKKSEEFKKGNDRGIWTGAEGETFIDNAKKIPAFNPEGSYSYNEKINKNYDNEVHKTLAKFLKDNGWYTEFYDNATAFFYPIWSSKEARDKFIEQGKKDGFIQEKLTDDAKEFIEKKIKTLIDEGRPQKQAIAMAYAYAKKEGYNVPNKD